ncbi:MAG: hypothetical protein NVS4B8_03770 [Herpetosiphon sp.]
MDDRRDHMYWRDEILQILFWFRGEALGESVTPRELTTFLNTDEDVVSYHLERLTCDNYVTRDDGPPVRYQLTDWGITEAGRRFADEFEGLTGQAHGECNNPNCSCRTLGPSACASHTPHSH